MRILISIFFCLVVLSCSNADPSPSVERSGDAELDQTASFLLYHIERFKNRPDLSTPSPLVGYITSAMGKGEIIPPSEEFEKDAAKYYKGPKLPNDVNFFSKWRQDSFQPKQIVLEGDDERKIIIAKAYRNKEPEPFFTWEWEIK